MLVIQSLFYFFAITLMTVSFITSLAVVKYYVHYPGKGITLYTIASLLGLVSIWLEDVILANSRISPLLIISESTLELFCYLITSVVYIYPMLRYKISLKGSLIVFFSWNLLFVLLRLLSHFSISQELNGFLLWYFGIFFILFSCFPLPFLFHQKWKRVQVWKSYPFLFPLTGLIFLISGFQELSHLSSRLYLFGISRIFQMLILILLAICIIKVNVRVLTLYSCKISEWKLSLQSLTSREKEILHLINSARTYSEIAEELYVSVKTVNTHIYNIYKKFGVKNRLQLLNLIPENKF